MGMNKLPLETRVRILNLLVEGSSMRSITRVCDVSINTVTKLLVEAGQAAEAFHDRTVVNVKSERVQCDEIWSFCYAKDRTAPKELKEAGLAGDVWTWTALDSDSKLMLTWYAGGRDAGTGATFMEDVKARLANRVQLTTDGHRAYLEAVRKTFGEDVDYAQLVKKYGPAPDKGPQRRYSPAQCVGADRSPVTGNPDADHISTSHVERANLSMRMGMRRFTRLTNAFSKKIDNHLNALALYFFHYNFCRIHKSLRVSPAQQAGITDELLSMENLCAIMDAANPAKKRGPYKKAAA